MSVSKHILSLCKYSPNDLCDIIDMVIWIIEHDIRNYGEEDESYECKRERSRSILSYLTRNNVEITLLRNGILVTLHNVTESIHTIKTGASYLCTISPITRLLL